MASLALPRVDEAPTGSRPSDLAFLLFLAATLPFACIRLLDLRDAQVSFAPLFFLIATVRWGYVRGAVAALLLTLPALWLWGMTLQPLIAVGQIAALRLLRRHRHLMLAEATGLYYLAVTPLWLLLSGTLHPAPFVSLLAIDHLAAQILLAAAADLLVRSLTIRRSFPFCFVRRRRSLARVIHAAINFVVALLIQSALVQQVDIIAGQERQFHDRVHAEVADLAGRHAVSQSAADRQVTLTPSASTRVTVLLSKTAAGFADRAVRALGPACRAPFDDRRLGPGRLVGMRLRPCETGTIVADGRPIQVAILYRDTPVRSFSWLDPHLLMLLLAGGIAVMFRVTVTRELSRSLERTSQMLAHFGTADLAHATPGGFREFEQPLREFVDRNNAYVAAVEERERLSQSFLELERSLSLRLLSDIRFDPANGELHFSAEKTSGTPIKTMVQVHASDCDPFGSADGNDQVTIEFRAVDGEEHETWLITLQQAIGRHHWAKGLVYRLRQPRHLREVMNRQARLADLGNIAALISHELKQPLFTILMAAEKINLRLIDPGSNQKADIERYAASIAAQVDRARTMIQHVSRYSQGDIAEPLDLAEVAEAAVAFLKPLFDEKDIRIDRDIGAGPHPAFASKVALEQVMVNALQNSIDAIGQARDAGRAAGAIRLTVTSAGDRLHCTIADDGIGLDPGVDATAFTPFFTTKPLGKGNGLGLFISRRIIAELDGSICLSRNAPHGARLKIALPMRV